MQLRIANPGLFAALGLAAALACATVPALADTATPSPSPTPPPTPPPVTVDGTLSVGTFFTNSNAVNAVGSLDTATGADQTVRTNITNAVITAAKGAGIIRWGLAAGIYDLPVVGVAGNPTIQKGANTNLFSGLPSWYVEYAPSANFNVSAGQQFALLGTESTFTYQNINIQRGLLWNMEPVVSRGIRGTYTEGKWTGQLEYNDGFYSGDRGAVEGLLGYATSPSTTVSLAFIVPDANTPGNITSGIANKREYDLMLMSTAGRWSLSPYVLFVDSPSSSALGYTADEHAAGAALLGLYTLNSAWSVGARAEYVRNGSAVGDTSPNADLVGYGAGSGAWSFTITPTYKLGPNTFFRGEASEVAVSNLAPGLGFGSGGTNASQFRLAVEAGVQF